VARLFLMAAAVWSTQKTQASSNTMMMLFISPALTHKKEMEKY
jgi:hypothetical protein